jgi:hypothetical protein
LAYDKQKYALRRQAELDRSRLKLYGITPQDFRRMLAKQGGVCAICKGPEPTGMALAVDHDHVTGRVRGLLCSNCNKGLGCFKDSPCALRTAALYLLNETSS